MTKILFEISLSSLSIILLSTTVLSGCGHVETKEEAHNFSMSETRLATLEAELKDQRTEIRRLGAAMEVLSMSLREGSSKNMKKSPNLPMSKTRSTEPKTEQWRESEGSAADSSGIAEGESEDMEGELPAEPDDEREEDAVVADSRHEGMHWYYRGVEALKQGDYDQAVNFLRTFLKDNADHVYADRAEFLISRAHFLNREYGLVIVGTNLLEKRYPNSLKLPDAVYQKSLSYLGLGQREEAKRSLKDLIVRFPKDPVADMASRKLAELSVDETGSRHAPLLLEARP